ncbi:hypothetical protein HK098_006863 [Nowakowskiella sp. JEL0407]|nr:hypothetical protein HK098_006863 [Nowakowskiella sp. JEL0407]
MAFQFFDLPGPAQLDPESSVLYTDLTYNHNTNQPTNYTFLENFNIDGINAPIQDGFHMHPHQVSLEPLYITTTTADYYPQLSVQQQHNIMFNHHHFYHVPFERVDRKDAFLSELEMNELQYLVCETDGLCPTYLLNMNILFQLPMGDQTVEASTSAHSDESDFFASSSLSSPTIISRLSPDADSSFQTLVSSINAFVSSQEKEARNVLTNDSSSSVGERDDATVFNLSPIFSNAEELSVRQIPQPIDEPLTPIRKKKLPKISCKSSSSPKRTPNNYKKWTAEEDELLRNAVQRYGTNGKWTTIAMEVPGRNPIQCSTRWSGALNSTIHKGRWTDEEDRMLLKAYKDCCGENANVDESGNLIIPWNLIAKQIPGRTQVQCIARYQEALDPSVKKGRWSKDEDELLKAGFDKYGCCWVKIAEIVPGRTQRQCRTRWLQLKPKLESAFSSEYTSNGFNISEIRGFLKSKSYASSDDSDYVPNPKLGDNERRRRHKRKFSHLELEPDFDEYDEENYDLKDTAEGAEFCESETHATEDNRNERRQSLRKIAKRKYSE